MLRSNCKYQCSSEKGKCQEQFQSCMHTPLANHASSGQTGWVCGWVAMSGQGACTAACTKKKRRTGWAGVKQLKGACLCMQKLFWTDPTEVLVPQWAGWAGCRDKGWKLLQAALGKLESGIENDFQRGAAAMHLLRDQWLPNCTPAPN